MLIWWKSAVNRSFFLCLAACRMRSSACDTLSRSCARRVLCWSAFPLVPALGSTDSAADRSALFVGFTAGDRSRFGAFLSKMSSPAGPAFRGILRTADDRCREEAQIPPDQSIGAGSGLTPQTRPGPGPPTAKVPGCDARAPAARSNPAMSSNQVLSMSRT